MRKGCQNVGIITEGNKFYGISLGYDFTAEHEWGIKDMQTRLGIDTNKIGADGRRVTNTTKMRLLTKDKLTMLTTRSHEDDFDKSIPYDLKGYDLNDNRGLFTAWDGNDFCVIVNNVENAKYLKDLYEAALNSDMLIGSFRNLKAFEGTSLSLTIGSNLPKEAIDQMYQTDKAKVDLSDYEDIIGMTKLKEEASKVDYQNNHYFLACSPSWISYGDPVLLEQLKAEIGTKYDIQYWINYSDDDNNYGYYKVEEIIKWLSTPGLKLTQIRNTKTTKM